MGKRGRDSIDTNSSTSRPPSRAQRQHSPTSPGTASTNAEPPSTDRLPEGESLEPPAPHLFIHGVRTVEEVQAEMPALSVENTAAFPPVSSSSSSSPSGLQYTHYPPKAVANALAYRVGLQPTSTPRIPLHQAAAAAGLSVPLLLAPTRLSSSSVATTSESSNAGPSPQAVSDPQQPSRQSEPSLVPASPSSDKDSSALSHHGESSSQLPTMPASPPPGAAQRAPSSTLEPPAASTAPETAPAPTPSPEGAEDRAASVNRSQGDPPSQGPTAPVSPPVGEGGSTSPRPPPGPVPSKLPKVSKTISAAQRKAHRRARYLEHQAPATTRCPPPQRRRSPLAASSSPLGRYKSVLEGAIDASNFGERLGQAASSLKPKIARVLSMNVDTLLFTTFQAQAVEKMKAAGWDVVYWIERDPSKNPQGLAQKTRTLEDAIKERWLKDGSGQLRKIRSVLYSQAPGEEDIWRGARESNMEAAAFFCSTVWDGGPIVGPSEVTDACYQVFASSIGDKARAYIPHIMDRVINVVRQEELVELLPGFVGYPTVKLLPYTFQVVFTFVLWEEIVKVNVDRVLDLLNKPAEGLMNLGIEQICGGVSHPDFAKSAGFDSHMEGIRGFHTVDTANGVHLIQGEEELEKEERKRVPYAIGERPTPHNDDARSIIERMAVTEEHCLVTLCRIPGRVGLGFLRVETNKWIMLIRHFRGNLLMIVLQLRRRVFCTYLPHAVRYLMLMLQRAAGWVWGASGDIVELWLLAAVSDLHMLLVARILVAGMTELERRAALRPGSRIWEELMGYRDLLHLGLEDSVRMFCRNQIFGEEYMDLRAEILNAVQKVVDEYNLRPFDHMVGWVHELTRQLTDNPNGARFNRYAPYPGFLNHVPKVVSTFSEQTYSQGVPPRVIHGGLDTRCIEEDLLAQAVADQAEKIEASRREWQEQAEKMRLRMLNDWKLREELQAAASREAAAMISAVPPPSGPPPKGGTRIRFAN